MGPIQESMGLERFSAVLHRSKRSKFRIVKRDPQRHFAARGTPSGEPTMRTTIFAAATALALSAAPAFAAGGYAFQTDPLPVQAGEHVAGNLTLEGQRPGAERLVDRQQLQLNALRSQNLGTYLWAPSEGNGS
jgi:hypothetical protein